MNNDSKYQERFSLIEKTINLEPAERVPVLYMGVAFAPRYMGMSMAKFCGDPEASFEVTLQAMEKLGELDGINMLGGGLIGPALSGLWLSRVAVPGRELPSDSLWQVKEAEIMTRDDYDLIIEQGWQAFLAGYMPKVVDMEEFQGNMAWIGANLPRLVQTMRERGYVTLCAGATTIPFEYFSGGRSLREFALDLHRIPDKVKAAMDAILPDLIQAGIGVAKFSGVPRVWVGGWRAASSFVSPKLWDEFVYPYYHQMVHALAEAGVVSVLHFDQDWTRDLARFRDFPAKQCVLNLDGKTDIRKAKEVLGDHMAIMGDVPSSLLAAGSPENIYDYVRQLIRDVGPNGLILCPGCDAPINAKPENMEAFVAAGQEFGSLAFA